MPFSTPQNAPWYAGVEGDGGKTTGTLVRRSPPRDVISCMSKQRWMVGLTLGSLFLPPLDDDGRPEVDERDSINTSVGRLEEAAPLVDGGKPYPASYDTCFTEVRESRSWGDLCGAAGLGRGRGRHKS